MILYKHKWRVKEPHFDLFENRKIPGIEIRLSDQGLQFLDKGNLFFFAYEIDAIERVLKYIGTRWDINSVKGSEIPFSVYLNIANGQAEKAA
ncbi:hypothetical protein EHQ76_07000 [Leptospira barantonii]|uniref:Uncharacterized protein n=1 Tax=Leptospira barantonii TaxID=2023184 RepID=A0A5F2BK98_9LEPT|nr:hypothetical protein [Leptospira barantonii]TGM06006.1 hypothetical protein EHQ76_07000 [Leptospira barantonii]